MKLRYVIPLITGIALYSCSADAASQQWVLSQAMSVGVTADLPNPVGPWTFMNDRSNSGKQANYTVLGNYNVTTPGDYTEGGRVNGWTDLQDGFVYASIPKVDFNNGNSGLAFWSKGNPHFHPGLLGPTIVRWTSPISGYLNIYGWFRSVYPACGDAVGFQIIKEDAVLGTYAVNKGIGSIFSFDNIYVFKGARLYLSINNGGASNAGCDHVEGDLIISTQDMSRLMLKFW